MSTTERTPEDLALELTVRERAGVRSLAEARRAFAAALGALRCALADDDARALAAVLPVALGAQLRRPAASVVDGLDGLRDEAARRERVSPGFALEHVEVVLEVLAERLDADLATRLRKHLPPDIARLLRGRLSPPEPPPYVHRHPSVRSPERQTLSRARPGASDTIADARHSLAHTRSPARDPAARADRMVATAHSTRPADEDETLASKRAKDPPE